MLFQNFYQKMSWRLINIKRQNKMRILLAFMLLAAAKVSFGQQASIEIDKASETTINKNIYGHFAEHLGRCIYDGFYRNGKIKMDIVEAMRKIKMPLLRWPGGCFADNYHWKDGIGALDKRAKSINIMWGMVPEDNSFGTSEFLQLCSLIGCEPYLAGNVGTGSPEELESWVEYCNYDGTSSLSDLRKINGHPNSYHVRYWGIGNESWGCGGRMTPEAYAQKFRTFANYVREYPGSPVSRIASGANSDDYEWTEYLMAHISSRWVQGIGVHYYTSINPILGKKSATDFGELQYFGALKNALKMEEIVSKHTAIMDKYDSGKKVALIIDEWGIWTDVEPGTNPDFLFQQNSLRDALIGATTLNIFNNHCERVRMANLAQTINVLQSLVLTSGDSMVLTPTYYVFDLYKVHQNAKWIPIKIQSPNYDFNYQSIAAVNASASVDSNRAMHISLVNLDPTHEMPITIHLNDSKASTISAQILTSDKFNDVNTFSKPDKVVIHLFSDFKMDGKALVVNMPAKSIVVLEIR
jgi:alpha-L-arabinofuranosidase